MFLRVLSRLALLLAISVPAFSADSVFVDRAFNGTWGASFPPFIPQVIGPVRFAQTDPSDGIAAIDGLAGAGTAARICPPATEKREFYSGSYDYSMGGELYGCTNGSTFAGVYRDYNGADYGSILLTQTDSGPPAMFAGTYTNAQGETGNFNGIYQGGGIATPLALAPPDQVTILMANPSSGTLAAGSLQDFSVTVEYDLNRRVQAFVRLILSDSQLRQIAASSQVPVQLADPKLQTELQILQAAIPEGSPQVYLRAEMRTPGGEALASTPQLVFNVSNTLPPMLTVAPTRLRFAAKAATPGTFSQTLMLRKSGSGGPVSFTAARVGDSAWLASVTPSAGQAGTVTVTVTVNTQGLAPGTYVDAVRISSALADVTVPATLTVTAAGPVLSLNKNALRFETRQGQGSSATATISVRNAGDAGSAVNWTARLLRGQGLLNLSPAGGSSTPASPSGLNVTLAPNATSTLGGNYALIEIADPNAQSSPQYVTVVVDVAAANSPAVPLLSPAGFFFLGVQGGPAPPSQSLAVNISQTAGANFTAAPGTSLVGTNPGGGVTSTSSPAQVGVSVNTAGRTPGVYRDTVGVGIGSTTRTARVTVVVRPPLAAPQLPAFGRAANGCTPTRAVLVENSLFGNFSVPAGYPAALVANLYDDCGDPRSDGSIVATFSNGDPPLSLLADPGGAEYTATWQTGIAQNPTTITLTGAITGLTSDTVAIQGGVGANSTPPPSLAPGGFLHNLNPIVGAPLAPGTVTQVYGDNLAAAPQSAPSVPLPTKFSGVEVIVGGRSAPIYYVSKTQLTVQLPSELDPNKSYTAVVASGNALTLPEQVDLVPVQPGTVAFASGLLVAQHSDFSLVTAENPAKPGELLVLYLVGMGATTPPVASGVASPGTPLASTNEPPVVTIDGQAAEILFSGLTPGGVGLYQINLRVPANARSGELPVEITQAGVKANATRLIVQ